MCNPRLTIASAVLAMLFNTAPLYAAAPHQPTGFLDKTIAVDGYAFGYQLYVPMAYTVDQKWPVIVYLHGTGESGTDNRKQSGVGLGTAIRSNAERVQALVLFPQLPATLNWDESGSQDLVIAILRDIFANFNTDLKRVYLTGWSEGGEGSFRLAARYPNIFAAVVPLSGGFLAGVEDIAPLLVDVPIWTFAADSDATVPVHYTTDLVAQIKKAGGKKICFREIPGDKVLDLYGHEIRNGHSIWRVVYEQSARTGCGLNDCHDFTCDVLDWMLSNTR